MSTLYIPRRPKRVRIHKSIPRGGLRLRSPRFSATQALVVASDYGQLNWRHLEAGRRFLVRQVRRSRVQVLARLRQPLTAKSKQARMGKGKGKLRGWVAYVRPGTVLYEVGPTARRSWTTHRNAATRLSGRFPFERMAYKFSYGVQVRRRTLLNYRRQLPYAKRPRYGAGDGLSRVSRRHPDGGIPRYSKAPNPCPLPPSPLKHRIGVLMKRMPLRRRDFRRPLMARLLLHHWRFLARQHRWTALEPSTLNQLNNTVRSLDRLRFLYRFGRRFFRRERIDMVRDESLAHPEFWRVSFLDRNHPLVLRQEPLDPAGGRRWLRYYPPRMLMWRRYAPSAPNQSSGSDSDYEETLGPLFGAKTPAQGETPEGSGESYAEDTDAESGESSAEDRDYPVEVTAPSGGTKGQRAHTADPEPSPFSGEGSPYHWVRRMVEAADWGYKAYVSQEPPRNPMLTVLTPPTPLPDPGFLVPRSPEAAAHAIVAARAQGIQRLWVVRRMAVRWWWLAPWMHNLAGLRLNRLMGKPRIGPEVCKAVVRANATKVARAEAARRKVLAYFKRRAEAFAERQAQNLRDREEALAAGLTPPPLLVSKKMKLSDSDRMAKSAYRPPTPPPPPVSEPVLVVAVGDYPVEQLARLESMHEQVLWNMLQESCAQWGLALEVSRDHQPWVTVPGAGRLPLSWLMAWIRRLQWGISGLRKWLRRRRKTLWHRRRMARRMRQPNGRKARPFWGARRLRRRQWRFLFRFWRDQPRELLPAPPERSHPQPQPPTAEELERERYRRRVDLRYTGWVIQRRLRRLARERRRQQLRNEAANQPSLRRRWRSFCLDQIFL